MSISIRDSAVVNFLRAMDLDDLNTLHTMIYDEIGQREEQDIGSNPERYALTTHELAIARQNKIKGIKLFKDRTGLRLRMSKMAVEYALAQNKE